jgi:large subunit ribosomal protein L9
MKIILTQEVTGLGTPGDIVEVKDGYGRNYLLPQGFAIPWSKGGEKQIVTIKRARGAREIRDLGHANEVKAQLEGLTVKAGGPQLDRRRLELPGHVKTVGDYRVQIKLHPEVAAVFTLKVSAAK